MLVLLRKAKFNFCSSHLSQISCGQLHSSDASEFMISLNSQIHYISKCLREALKVLPAIDVCGRLVHEKPARCHRSRHCLSFRRGCTELHDWPYSLLLVHVLHQVGRSPLHVPLLLLFLLSNMNYLICTT